MRQQWFATSITPEDLSPNPMHKIKPHTQFRQLTANQ